MLSYILIAIFSYLLGVLSIVLFSVLKISSKCSKEEDKIDYGQIAYDEIEKREKSDKET